MFKKILSFIILILLLFSTITSISFGKDSKITEQNKLLDNLVFYSITPNGFNEEKIEYYEKQLLQQNANEVINEQIISTSKELSKIQNPKLVMSLSYGPMDSAWPMKCHDLHHTGQSPYSTSSNPGVEKWRFKCDWIEDGSVIGNDGTIYFGDFDNYLYALKPDGTLKWRYRTGNWIWSSPAIAEDGTIYVGSWDTKLYAINPDGGLKWATGSGGSISSSPAIAEDGTIYFGTMSSGNSIIAMDPNGTIKWKYQTGYSVVSSPAIADDGTIYIGSGDTYFYAINPDGTLKWRYKTGDIVKSHPSIADDNTVYFDSFDGYIYALYDNGTLRWRQNLKGNGCSSCAIGVDGTLYIGSSSEFNRLYALYPANGSIKWIFNIGNGYISHSSPAISADGTIYFGTDDSGYIYAVNPDGSEKWRKKIANKWVESSSSIGKDGTVYIGSSYDMGSGYLHAFGIGDFEADANGPYYGLINEPVQFTGSARNGTEPYSWLWSFGDEDTSTVQNPTHIYTNPGTYIVNLTVTDSSDNFSSDITWAKIKESNNPPNKPSINGPTKGKPGIVYNYIFVTTDIDNDEFVYYYIDWDDNTNSGWIGPYTPGQEVTMSHSWNEKDTYTIKCKAKDNYGAESDWETLSVTIPKTRRANNMLIYKFVSEFLLKINSLMFNY